IDGANFGAPVALTGGSANSGSISTLTAGNHTVEAFFTSADTNFNDSNDTLDGGQTVNKRDTLTTVSSSLNPSTFGESVSFTATVVGTGAGAGNPSGGSVQFKIDGANFGAPVALAGGSASSGSISTLTAGNHTVEALFTSADTNFNDSNDTLDGGQTVNKRDTLTTVSSSLNPSTFGESVSFTATVVGTGAGTGNPSGGTVQFKIDGANFGAPVALAGGSASSGSISTLTAGNHTVEAFVTSADTNFNDSNDSLDGGQTVNKRNTLTTISSSLNPSTYGQTVTFIATVTGTGPGTGNPSGGSVQFKIEGANFGAPVALSGGSATSSAINSLTAGNHTVEAVFTSADINFNNSSDLLDGGQNVNKASLTITASSHTITFNDPVPTITASYAGFVLGEGPGNLTTQPSCSTTYTVGSLIGTYPTKCENAVSANYTFTYINGTVTVLTACSAFNGFLSPIGGAVETLNGGSFADPVRAFKLNSTIPVKFSATCFGVPLTTGIHTLQAIKYSNSTTGESPIDASPTDAATTGNQFRLTDSQWHYNLNTRSLGASAQGIWLLKATLFDGSTYTVWVEIKK
ncbi:MAG: Ig-like domain repeat protein, partial [Acidobacteria bacterium]|nr:Ig-like domain repeat protein [Acidobacteriota bacterium]